MWPRYPEISTVQRVVLYNSDIGCVIFTREYVSGQLRLCRMTAVTRIAKTIARQAGDLSIIVDPLPPAFCSLECADRDRSSCIAF
jgi:hypothetical protein